MQRKYGPRDGANVTMSCINQAFRVQRCHIVTVHATLREPRDDRLRIAIMREPGDEARGR
jgi:hypothetical protein